MTFSKVAIYYTVGAVCVPTICAIFYKICKGFNTYSKIQEKIFTDCIIATGTDYSSYCQESSLHSKGTVCPEPYCYRNCMNKLLKLINRSKESILLCIYLITSEELGAAVVEAHKRNVKIRIIMDADMSACSGSRLPLFQEQGIEVRTNRRECELMHHKFFLIDCFPKQNQVKKYKSLSIPKNGLVAVGSMNWTMQAIHGNWEFLNVTSDLEVINAYHDEFERLWKLFDS